MENEGMSQTLRGVAGCTPGSLAKPVLRVSIVMWLRGCYRYRVAVYRPIRNVIVIFSEHDSHSRATVYVRYHPRLITDLTIFAVRRLIC